jgi:hypothetical protein
MQLIVCLSLVDELIRMFFSTRPPFFCDTHAETCAHAKLRSHVCSEDAQHLTFGLTTHARLMSHILFS